MSRNFEDVEKLSCTQEDGQHECEVVYGDNYSTDVTVEGVLVDGAREIEYNGGAEISVGGKDCRTRGDVLVCED